LSRVVVVVVQEQPLLRAVEAAVLAGLELVQA